MISRHLTVVTQNVIPKIQLALTLIILTKGNSCVLLKAVEL